MLRHLLKRFPHRSFGNQGLIAARIAGRGPHQYQHVIANRSRTYVKAVKVEVGAARSMEAVWFHVAARVNLLPVFLPGISTRVVLTSHPVLFPCSARSSAIAAASSRLLSRPRHA